MPGVQIVAASRGLSVRPDDSATFDPDTPLDGITVVELAGRRTPQDGPPPRALADRLLALKSATTAEEALKWTRTIIAAHEERPAPGGPATAIADSVDRDRLGVEYEELALAQVVRLRRRARHAAQTEAATRAELAAQAEEQRRERLRETVQAKLDADFEPVAAGEPTAVLDALEDAFANDAIPAAAVDLQAATATLVVLLPPLSALPERTVGLSDAEPTGIHHWSEEERVEFYSDMLASQTLAVARQALAVAPTLHELRVVVARNDDTEPELAGLWCGVLTREALQDQGVGTELVLQADDVLIAREPTTGEIQALELDTEPEIAELLETVGGRLAETAQDAISGGGRTGSGATDREPVAATKGSRRRMQEAVEWDSARIERRLERWHSLARWSTGPLSWVSPVRDADFRQLRDDLWTELELPKPTPQRDGFWPKRGPIWDGVAVVPGPQGRRGVLLVDAKSYEGQLASPPAAQSESKLPQVHAALEETKDHLGIPARAAWEGEHYQLANRLAFLYYLRVKRELPAWLLSVYFLGDAYETGPYRVTGPIDAPGWKEAIERAQRDLMLPPEHELSPYVWDLFLPVID